VKPKKAIVEYQLAIGQEAPAPSATESWVNISEIDWQLLA
jgi:hypothetical protein